MKISFLLAFCAWLMMGQYLSAQDHSFIDGSAAAGLTELDGGYGIIVGDYNADGYEDVFVAGQGFPNQLLKNNGDGSFDNVIIGSGLEISANAYTAVWTDIDNDNDLDLFIANFSYLSNVYTNKMYLNDGNGQFSDITFTSGLTAYDATRTVITADVDNDGYTDIYVCNINMQNTLWRNNGDNTFTNTTFAAGLFDVNVAMGAIFFDYDNDQDLALYLVHDNNQANILYQNDGTGQFVDVSESSGLGLAAQGMGVDFADIDNDGWFDVYVTNLGPNYLFRNNQDGTFTEYAMSASTDDGGMGWACFFLDHDNDTDQDLYVVNQYGFAPLPNQLYDNDGTGYYNSISHSTFLESTLNGFGGTWLDMDNNGHQDIMIGNLEANSLQLFLNQAEETHYVDFNLEGTVSATDAFGTRVEIYANGQRQIAEKKSSSSFSAQSSHRVHFGLGEAELIDSMHVLFPSGVSNVLYSLPADKIYTVVEDSATSVIDCFPTFDLDLEYVSNNEIMYSAFGDADIDSWSIQFGDGQSQNQSAGNYSYTMSGDYEVCMIAENHCTWDSICQTVNIDCIEPSASFELATNGLDLITFNVSADFDSVLWQYGDGLESDQIDGAHSYESEGTYEVCLTVFGECNQLTICDSVTITCPLPLAEFDFEIDGLEVNFSDLTLDADSLIWDFAGLASSSEESPDYTFDSEGSYEICLTAFNQCGQTVFCDSVQVVDIIDFLPEGSTDLLIDVYPNPAKDMLNVHCNDLSVRSIALRDAQGRVAHLEPVSQSYNQVTLSLSACNPGIYLLIIGLENGQQVAKRFTIE
jgi:PKD repeat protein